MNRQRWNTETILELLEDLDDVVIEIFDPGGDHDTEIISIAYPASVAPPDGAICQVFGMLLNDCIEDPTDSDVDVLFACHSERYGMEHARSGDLILAGHVMAQLESNGYHASNQGWKAYF